MFARYAQQGFCIFFPSDTEISTKEKGIEVRFSITPNKNSEFGARSVSINVKVPVLILRRSEQSFKTARNKERMKPETPATSTQKERGKDFKKEIKDKSASIDIESFLSI